MPLLSTIRSALIPNVHAQTEVIGVDPGDCGISTLSCQPDLLQYVTDILFNNDYIFLAFHGFLFAMLVLYGFQLALKSRDEASIGEAVKAYTQAFIGVILVSGAFILADSFATVGEEDVINVELLERNLFEQLIGFALQMIGAAVAANIMIQGLRLIVAVNDQNVEQSRKNFIQAISGGIIVMLAVPIISRVSPGAFNTGINNELVGLANTLATLFGFLAVLSFVIAGIMMILAYNDGLKDRARTIALTAIIALVVVIASWSIIQIVLPTTPL